MGLENLHLIVAITGRCNKRCAHCSIADILVKAHDDTADLNITIFKKALISLETKIDQITIAGGEPTLHPDFKKFVLFASRYANKLQIDTNLTTMPQTEEEIEEHLKWLPANAQFLVGFDNYHYPNLTPEFETKLLNFIRYCIRTKRILKINSVAPKIELPGIKNRALADLLIKLYQDAQRLGKKTEQGYIFWEKADRVGNARFLPREDTRSMPPAKLHKNLINDSYLLILPNSQVYVDDSAMLFPLNPENIFYMGDLKKERLDDIWARLFHRARNFFGRPLKLKKEIDLQRALDNMYAEGETPAFVAYMRRITDYKKQRALREHTLKRLREMLRRR